MFDGFWSFEIYVFGNENLKICMNLFVDFIMYGIFVS